MATFVPLNPQFILNTAGVIPFKVCQVLCPDASLLVASWHIWGASVIWLSGSVPFLSSSSVLKALCSLVSVSLNSPVMFLVSA